MDIGNTVIVVVFLLVVLAVCSYPFSDSHGSL